jgi:hypothetical protein
LANGANRQPEKTMTVTLHETILNQIATVSTLVICALSSFAIVASLF